MVARGAGREQPFRKYIQYQYAHHDQYRDYDEKTNELINTSIFAANGINPIIFDTSIPNVGNITITMHGYDRGSARVVTHNGRKYNQNINAYVRPTHRAISQQPRHHPPLNLDLIPSLSPWIINMSYILRVELIK